jgi:hypothetical protein
MSPARRKAAQAEQLHYLLVDLVDDGSVEYRTKARPVRMKSFIRGKGVKQSDGSRRKLQLGEFYEEVRSVTLRPDPNMKRTGDGYFVWKSGEEIELDLLAQAHAWEKKQEQRAHGPGYSAIFRSVWLREIGRVYSKDYDRNDIPGWCRAGRNARHAVALDKLLGEPLEMLGEFYPGLIETEDRLLQILREHAPVPKKSPAKKSKVRQGSIFG